MNTAMQSTRFTGFFLYRYWYFTSSGDGEARACGRK